MEWLTSTSLVFTAYAFDDRTPYFTEFAVSEIYMTEAVSMQPTQRRTLNSTEPDSNFLEMKFYILKTEIQDIIGLWKGSSCFNWKHDLPITESKRSSDGNEWQTTNHNYNNKNCIAEELDTVK